MAAPLPPRLSRWQRLLALAGAAMVLALAVLTASPDLHGILHSADADHDDACAIVLFADGVTAADGEIDGVEAGLVASAANAIPPAEARWSPPRYLHRPERGPPAV